MMYIELTKFSEAEGLCLKLTEKISTNTDKRLLLSHLPLLLVALEVSLNIVDPHCLRI